MMMLNPTIVSLNFLVQKTIWWGQKERPRNWWRHMGPVTSKGKLKNIVILYKLLGRKLNADDDSR